MEPPSATLDEITTDPNSSKILDHDFISPSECLYIDEVEYTLGLERGGLNGYCGDTSLMSARLHSDMQAFLEDQVWALLPSTEILDSLFNLFTHNRGAATPDGRVLFTDHLPVAAYTYRLLPPVPKDSDQKPVYIRGTRYDPPYANLPLIQAHIHPAVAFSVLMDYVRRTFSMTLNGCPLIDEPLYMSILQIERVLTQPVPIQWVHGTWKEHQDRGIVPVKKPRKPPQEPPVNVRSKTPEVRDYMPDHPLVLQQQQKAQKYMRENNVRSTALAKGKASDIKKHHFLVPLVATVETVETVDVLPAKRARSPPSPSRTEPVEEPPAKRPKKGGRKKTSFGSAAYLPTPPPVRRSTRKPKNPPKYT